MLRQRASKAWRFCLWLTAALAMAPQLSAQVTVFFEDFESPFPASGGWIVGDIDPIGPAAYWNTVDAAFGGEGAHSGNRKAYCAGFGYGGTTISPSYQSDMIAFMSRSINLNGYAGATLSFWFKVPSIETGIDLARVTIDGETVWSTGAVVTAWTQATVSLDHFVGGTRTLRFEFVSNESVAFEGWYLDDILLTGTFGIGPANDYFTNAFLIPGSRGVTNGSNVDATKEAGEPDHAGSAGGRSVWYRWTAPANGPVTFTTFGSSIDTLLAVYTGNAVAGLTLVASNDDLPTVFQESQVTFSAAAQTVYRVAVDGFNGAAGKLVLNWAQGPALNDLFASALTLTGNAGSTNADNFNATKETGEPDHADETGGASVWYRWTAPASRAMVFDTAGSALDTLLAVYTGRRVGNLSLIASNHYSADSLKSQLDFAAVAGTTYYIAIDGFDGAEWTFKLNWRPLILPRFTAIQTQATSGLQLTLTGNPGDQYEVQSSRDLSDWTMLGLLTNRTGTVQFVDPARSGLRFYRVMLEP